MYNWFGNDENFGGWTANAFAQRRSFPLNFILPRRFRSSVRQLYSLHSFSNRQILSHLAFLNYVPENENLIYKTAGNIYDVFETMLGTKKYLFGSSYIPRIIC